MPHCCPYLFFLPAFDKGLSKGSPRGGFFGSTEPQVWHESAVGVSAIGIPLLKAIPLNLAELNHRIAKLGQSDTQGFILADDWPEPPKPSKKGEKDTLLTSVCPEMRIFA